MYCIETCITLAVASLRETNNSADTFVPFVKISPYLVIVTRKERSAMVKTVQHQRFPQRSEYDECTS